LVLEFDFNEDESSMRRCLSSLSAKSEISSACMCSTEKVN